MKGHPESLGVTRLEGGEVSRPVRVRAPAWVHDQLRELGAAEVGELLAQALRWKAEGRPMGAELGAAPGAPAAAPSLDGVTTLRVLAAQIPQALKNKLRWSADRYTTLEAALSAGDVLHLDVTNGKAVWRNVEGETIRRDTVERLFSVGVLGN